MFRFTTPPYDPDDPNDPDSPARPTNWIEARAGNGIRWGLLVGGILLLVLAVLGFGGYLTAIPAGVQTIMLVGGGVLLVVFGLREWMARREG